MPHLKLQQTTTKVSSYLSVSACPFTFMVSIGKPGGVPCPDTSGGLGPHAQTPGSLWSPGQFGCCTDVHELTTNGHSLSNGLGPNMASYFLRVPTPLLTTTPHLQVRLLPFSRPIPTLPSSSHLTTLGCSKASRRRSKLPPERCADGQAPSSTSPLGTLTLLRATKWPLCDHGPWYRPIGTDTNLSHCPYREVAILRPEEALQSQRFNEPAATK